MKPSLAQMLAAGIALLAGTAPVLAEKPNFIPLATSSKWLLVSSQKAGLDEVKNWGGDPAIEKECGVKSVVRRTYTLYPENESVNVLIEDAADPSSAYSLFTLYRDDSMTPLANLPGTELGGNKALLRRGERFIRIVQPEDTGESTKHFSLSMDQLHSLLLEVGGAVQPGEDSRGLPGQLPAGGLVQGSEKYLLGEASAKFAMPDFRFSLLGFSQGAEARLATYSSGGAKLKVIAVTYPTPQIARQRFGTMENILQVNKNQGPQSVYGKLTGSYVILVFDAGSQRSAEKVLGQFRSTGYITWNQRYEGDQSAVIQMVRFVLANIIFSFILIGMALFGGILFFMSKVVARHWFPNSSWGQPEGNTIIRLNLS
jgi:Family of unknown function (DUF6599)